MYRAQYYIPQFFKMEQAKIDKLVEAFKAMGAMPDVDSPETLETWMADYVKSKGKGEVEVKVEDSDNVEDSDKEHEPEKASAAVGRMYPQTPRLSTFSGDTASKGDTSFDLWRYEVVCLQKDAIHSKAVILQAVRKSLRGGAGKVAMRLGVDADLDTILHKLDGVYGMVEAVETLIAEFYAAQQGKDEDVATWGCRLEDMLDKAKHQGQVAEKDMDQMLRNKFWMGLRSELKVSTRHKFDAIKEFDELRIQIRRIEHECKVEHAQESNVSGKPGKTTVSAKMSKIPDGDGQVSGTVVTELTGLVCKLTSQVDAIQKQLGMKEAQSRPVSQTQGGAPDTGWAPQLGHGYEQMGYSMPPAPHMRQGTFTPPPQPQGQTRAGQAAQPRVEQFQGTGYQSQGQYWAGQGQQQTRGPVTGGCWRCGSADHVKRDCPQGPECYRCHQRGHIARDCQVRMDHSRQFLGATPPSGSGR